MNTMTIQGTDIQVKEYRGQRVVTFKDIDTVHQRPAGTAKRNFDTNRNHFVSGVDFFKIPMKEFSTNIVPNSYKGGNPNNLVVLITETGYLMLVKSFTDDLAWKVQRELVDTYFKVREIPETVTQTVTITEPVKEENPEVFLEASRIMSGCLEGNRPYVLNILRHIVPDIDCTSEPEKVTEVTTEVQVLPPERERFFRAGVDIDVDRLRFTMAQKHISKHELARRANVCTTTVEHWISGKHKPVLQNRINLCTALGDHEIPY